MRKMVAVLVALLMAFGIMAVIGCGKSGVESVVGVYEAPGQDMTIEFKSDGTYVMTSGSSSLGGDYEVKGDEVSLTFAGVEESFTAKIEDGAIVIEGMKYEKK